MRFGGGVSLVCAVSVGVQFGGFGLFGFRWLLGAFLNGGNNSLGGGHVGSVEKNDLMVVVCLSKETPCGTLDWMAVVCQPTSDKFRVSQKRQE